MRAPAPPTPSAEARRAAGHVDPRAPVRSARRAAWRLWRSASCVTQQPLTTCTSARRGTLAVAVGGEALAQRLRVGLGDLAAQELDGEAASRRHVSREAEPRASRRRSPRSRAQRRAGRRAGERRAGRPGALELGLRPPGLRADQQHGSGASAEGAASRPAWSSTTAPGRAHDLGEPAGPSSTGRSAPLATVRGRLGDAAPSAPAAGRPWPARWSARRSPRRRARSASRRPGRRARPPGPARPSAPRAAAPHQGARAADRPSPASSPAKTAPRASSTTRSHRPGSEAQHALGVAPIAAPRAPPGRRSLPLAGDEEAEDVPRSRRALQQQRLPAVAATRAVDAVAAARRTARRCSSPETIAAAAARRDAPRARPAGRRRMFAIQSGAAGSGSRSASATKASTRDAVDGRVLAPSPRPPAGRRRRPGPARSRGARPRSRARRSRSRGRAAARRRGGRRAARGRARVRRVRAGAEGPPGSITTARPARRRGLPGRPDPEPPATATPWWKSRQRSSQPLGDRLDRATARAPPAASPRGRRRRPPAAAGRRRRAPPRSPPGKSSQRARERVVLLGTGRAARS